MEDLEVERALARRVYLCPHDDSVFCLVSPEDYEWAMQWKWQFTWDRHKRKRYATRSTTLPGRKRIKVYMHKAILNRSGKIQPSEKHTIGDHQDGDSLLNVRGNLEWATPSMNAINRRKPANDNYYARAA
jgi:hypothetical protein